MRPVERIPRQAAHQAARSLHGRHCPRLFRAKRRGEPFEKARQLLTRHWAVASWRARADILRTAEWLIGVGNEERGSDVRLRGAPRAFGRRRGGDQSGKGFPVIETWNVLLGAFPVLAMALAIVSIPLLCDCPPLRR